MPADELFVATDHDGRSHHGGAPVTWHLPAVVDGRTIPGDETAGADAPLVLWRPPGLLDALDSRIFRAEATGEVLANDEAHVEARAARLVAATPWDDARAARFALECAAHALGEEADAVLPDGSRLGDVVAEAGEVVASAGTQAEDHLGFLARLASARRLRRQGELVGDLALALLGEDHERARDALEDPAWATLASVAEAVLAAVESLRHLALPRYVEVRERASEAGPPDATGGTASLFTVSTPWGPLVPLAERPSPYEPAARTAREAAARARQAVLERAGPAAATAERSFQAQRLSELLAGP
ncbi:MAG TPA: hypothetical protein VKV23_01285 [Acidimicrobiales bacterium]|nr:hypothetical protein [Acidimicrobiales bacterium]